MQKMKKRRYFLFLASFRGGSDMGGIRRSWLRGWRVDVGGNQSAQSCARADSIRSSRSMTRPSFQALSILVDGGSLRFLRPAPVPLKILQPRKRNPPKVARLMLPNDRRQCPLRRKSPWMSNRRRLHHRRLLVRIEPRNHIPYSV